MKRLLTLAAVAAMLAAAAPASAMQAAPALIPVAAGTAEERAPDHAARAALIRRYFTAIQFDKLMNGMIDGMLDSVLMDPAIPADKRELVREVALESFAATMPGYLDRVVDVYAEEFTVEELEGMVEFYESPIGRSLTAKSVMLTQRTGELIAYFQPAFEADMQQRLCARIDCSPPVAPTVKRY